MFNENSCNLTILLAEDDKGHAALVKKNLWRKGIATEALSACLDWLFDRPGYTCAHAVTDADNLASRRLLQKVGMKYQGNVDLYDSVAKGNGLLPMYALTKEAYRERNENNWP